MSNSDKGDFLFSSVPSSAITPDTSEISLPAWNVLIVDDSREVHELTKLILGKFVFEDRAINFISAYSGEESLELLKKRNDIALILLDVVMETDHAGLDVTKTIREVLDNQLVRIILRTGQPGQAPEEKVVIDYDINDYKDKADLTSSKLKTMIVTALRGYRDLCRLEDNRRSLIKISNISSSLFQLQSLEKFSLNILTMLLPLWEEETSDGDDEIIELEPSALIASRVGKGIEVSAGTGGYRNVVNTTLDGVVSNTIMERITFSIDNRTHVFISDGCILFIESSRYEQGFVIYLEGVSVNDEWDSQLIRLLCSNISITYDNVWLLSNLENINTSLENKVKKRTRELEKSKEEAESATHAKSLFLSNMSHEIRTPLNAILGFAQLSLRNKDLPKANHYMIQAIETAGNHLLAVINDVLDLSKIEAGAMKTDESDFILSRLMDDISMMFAMRCEQKGLLWSLENTCDEEVEVRGDQGKLRQVLINLLGNAVKFTGSGSVRLVVRKEGKGQFLFEVIDTGPGIHTEDQSKIFDMFSQASVNMHTTGTGLGLSISKKQVELMGGELVLDSELGRGSKFSFSINLPNALKKVIEDSDSDKNILCLKAGSTLSALVVDDVEVNRVMLSSLLSDIGVEVISAANGQEAIQKLREKMVDIVYMDIRMPVMNGDEAVKHIREEFADSDVNCIAISAYSMAHEVEYYLSVGFDRYISKPFQFETIYQTLREYCGAEFEREAEISEPINNNEIGGREFSHVLLPAPLFDALMEAAELNRMTKIRQLLDELELIGGGGRELSAYLGKFLVNYDTESIIEVLKEIGQEAGT